MSPRLPEDSTNRFEPLPHADGPALEPSKPAAIAFRRSCAMTDAVPAITGMRVCLDRPPADLAHGSR